MKRFLCACFLLLWPLWVQAEDELAVSVTEKVVGFQQNTIAVQAPFDGTMMLQVHDSLNVYRTLTSAVETGPNTIVWDGLGENEQRLPTGACTMTAWVTGADGQTVSTECAVTVDRPRQAVVFALSTSDTLYLDETGESLRVEVKMVRAGRLSVAYYAAGNMTEPLAVRGKDCNTNRVFTYAWDGVIDGQRVPPGDYVLRFYAEESPEYARDVHVTVAEGARPKEEILLTRIFMPERDMTDAQIWAVMMQPSVVLDVSNTKDVPVRSEPGKGAGEVLGTVHGQSQGLNVLEIRDDGYAKVGAWNHESGAYIEGYVPSDELKVVRPRGDYGLLLDKQTQRMTVYQQGKVLAELPVSTGLITDKDRIRETAAGVFLLQEHMVDFSNKGYKYAYVMRYDGGNLLHQVGYQEENGRCNFANQALMLGMKASHGCVRIPAETTNGINAYWLWTHLPFGTRIIILDDEAQRDWETRAVSGQLPNVQPTAPSALADDETELTLTVGGDAVLGTRESWWDKEESFPIAVGQKGMAYPFSGLQEIFAADDMTFVNLECVLKADKAGENKDKEYRFRGLPEYAQILTEGSVEQVNIANNHHIDYGAEGRSATRLALEAAGVPYSGFGSVYVWEAGGHRVGFAGCRETTYKGDQEVIRRDVATLRRLGCEVIVYSCHWGTEYRATHNDLQREMAQAAMEAGVDIIVGTHPHVVQGIDTVGSTVVLWSLGNLVFGGTHDMRTFDGTLAQIRLRFSPEGYRGCTVSYLPILTSSAAPANDFHPVLAEGDDRLRILEQIQADSGFSLMDAMFFPAP